MGARMTQRLSAPDSAWWHMEEPSNPMVITGVLTFEDRLEFAQLRELIETKLLAHERFRQRVLEPRASLGRPRWVEDERLSLDYHVKRTVLPEPADRLALQERVSELASIPLDYERPPWQFHVVENFEQGSALVARIHHSIADGMALVHLLLGLDDDPSNDAALAEWGAHRRKWETRTAPYAEGWLAALRASPVARGTALAGAAVSELARLAAMRADPPTLFRGNLAMRKLVAWSEPLPLEEIKSVGGTLGATVNDVLLSVVAGALRRYLQERGGAVARLELRAVVPVDLRRGADLHLLGNKFGLVFLSLPVGVADPVERLLAVKRDMDRLKRSPQAFVTYGLLHVFGRLSKGLVGLVVNFLGKKATLVMTGVPGPREPLFFCGTRLRSLMAWVPKAGRLGLGVSVLSYAGEALMGVATDERLIPDPEALVRAYELAMAELLERAGVTAPAAA